MAEHIVEDGELLGCLQIVSDNAFIPSEKEFYDWIHTVSQLTDLSVNNITIRVVESTESQVLNKQYRDKNAPTNVLSFPSQLPAEIEPDYLGDIVICASIVEQEAQAQNKSVQAHWAHMLVHGVLHLKGYDHLQPDEAEEMESLEAKILASMGFPNPYEA